MGIAQAYIVAFIASFCTMVIEIVAGRILAPYVGVSIYTWTCIIGLILAGISIGAYIGGKLGDRFPRSRTLGWLLLLSGIATFVITPATDLVAGGLYPVSLVLRIFLVTLVLFFIPGCVLGTVCPVVVKLTLKNVENSGDAVGRIYAFSTLGAIAGTFLTGFALISWIGTRNTLIATSALLLFSASFWLLNKKRTIALYLIFVLISMIGLHRFVWSIPLGQKYYYFKESAYFTIRLSRGLSMDNRTVLEQLSLDSLVHSYTSLQNPFHMEYGYEKIVAEILTWRFPQTAHFNALLVGGGGYTIPRAMELYFPNAGIDVAEIDPEVTKTAHTHLGLPNRTRIRTFNMDGRWYVMNCSQKYDIIFIDAFNDVSVPYHLTTREFAGQLKSILRPGGLLVTNIVDHFSKGVFLPSYMKTVEQVFGRQNIGLISPYRDWENLGISTFVVVAGNGSLSLADMEKHVQATRKGSSQSIMVPDSVLNRFFNNPEAIIITDDYAPVDNLTARLFDEKYMYRISAKR